MRMRLTAHGIELSSELKDFVQRRIHFSLGRLAGRIKSLTVRLADVNGPRGGVDKCCDISIDAGLRQNVIVREQQATIHAAVALAVDRAERAVQRQMRLGNPLAERPKLSRPSPSFGD